MRSERSARTARRCVRSLAIGLCLLGLSVSETFARSELVDRIVAIIDQDVITLSEARQSLELRLAAAGTSPEPGDDDDHDLSAEVERLIEVRLVSREVDRFSDEVVPQAMVNQALAAVRATFPTEQAFLDTLSEQGFSELELRAQLRSQLATHRYLERRFRALTYVTDEEVEAYYRDELVPELNGQTPPPLAEVAALIRANLEERKFNQRVDDWIDELKSRARIRRYVW